jgi:hypothetical protein
MDWLTSRIVEIDNYSSRDKTRGAKTLSDIFTIGINDHKFQLSIYLGGYKNTNYVGIFISPIPYHHVLISFKLTLHGTNIKEFPLINHFFKDDSLPFIGYTSLLLSELIDPDNGFIVNDKIKIIISNMNCRQMTVSKLDNNLLHQCVKETYDDQQYCDFVIQIGENKINVHKCILASSSPVFKSMLNNGMQESLSGVLYIEDNEYNDVKFDAMKEVIKFIYTNSFSDEFVLNNMAVDVYTIVKKYQIYELDDILDDLIKDSICNDNVFKYFNLANKFNLTFIKKKTFLHICKNQLFAAPEFNILSDDLKFIANYFTLT